MDSMYIKALETRAKWLRWALDQESSFPYAPEMRHYTQALEAGDTFFMNKKFCSLVECARETIPDDLIFESEWMQAKNGWLYIENPFGVPLPATGYNELDSFLEKGKKRLADKGLLHDRHEEVLEKIKNGREAKIKISAIGWYAIPEGIHVGKGKKDELFRVTGEGAYHFMCYQELDGEFGTWSYFTLQNGDKIIDRIRAFEDFAAEDEGHYEPGRVSDMLHEIRWVYAAFYLMAQRLATTVQHNTDRHTRRRGERDRLPVTPFIRIVTLRRLEEDKKKNNAPSDIEYNWQWEVRGHWRSQWFPSEKVHKPVWIEAYIKGPEDKPFKSPSAKLFVAQR